MQVEFRHKGCHLDDSLKELVSKRVDHLTRFLDEPKRVEVFFEENNTKAKEDRFLCEVTVVSHGYVVRAHSTGLELLQAFDRVEGKLRHQLERLKTKVLHRSHPHHRDAKVANEDLGEDLEVRIAKAKSFRVPTLDPEEAAFQMDLLSHSFYLFSNAKTGRAAVVYRREDGTVGLIDQEAD
jgi:putative sigma-54 modulation protein